MTTHATQPTPPLDLRERGAAREGQPQTMDRRLFMQLLVLEVPEGGPGFEQRLGEAVAQHGSSVVVYQDVNHPWSAGLLTWSEDPANFVDRVRPALAASALGSFRLREDMTMIGRTYSTGYEPDLEYWLLRRPVETACNPAWPWAIWYPLRRSGDFEQL